MAGGNFKTVSLARTKESLKPKSVGKLTPDPYSYSHRITLDQDNLDQLGMTMPKVGDKFHVLGHAEVKSISQNDHGAGEKATRVELQMKRLGLKPKAAKGGGLLGAVNQGISEAGDE